MHFHFVRQKQAVMASTCVNWIWFIQHDN